MAAAPFATLGTRLVAGNWKMNGLTADLAELDALAAGLSGRPGGPLVAVCPPATLLAAAAARAAGSGIRIGAQDCARQPAGAFTGDVSAAMLADAGASLVILGHSERRAGHGESDAVVAEKTRLALAAGLVPIVCLGETEAQYLAGETLAVVRRQLTGSLPEGAPPDRLVIAYEPVWAIGTGRTPTADSIAQVHRALKAALVARLGADGAGVPVLYGGSVKPANAAEILALPGVDGALVGGASLRAADFLPIIKADPS